MSVPRAAARVTRRLPTRDELLAERCRRSLHLFVAQAWPLVEPGVPFVDGWHIEVICEHLEAVSRGEITRLLINQPPRTSKSSLVAVFWPAWEWLTRPQGKWLSITYSHPLTIRDSMRCRRLVQTQGGALEGTLPQRVGYVGLRRLLGASWVLTGDQNAKGRFDNSEAGYRIASAVHGSATGEGGDRIVCDDPHAAEAAQSDVERQRTIDWFDTTIPTRLNTPTSAQVIVGQRLHEEDLTGHLLEQGGWEHLCLPGVYEPDHKYLSPADRRTTPGETLDPVRLPLWRLEDLRKTLRAYGFAGQIQQLPAPAEGGILKKHWWRSYSTPPAVLSSALTSWDLTFGAEESKRRGKKGKKEGGSWNVGQVWGNVGPDVYLLDEVRDRWDFVDFLDAMRAFAAKWPQARPILIENKAAGAPAIATLRREIPGLIAIDPVKDKVARAESVAPFIEGGNVYLPEWALGHPVKRDGEWVTEQSSFPTGAANDRVDAMSQALSRIYLRDSAAQGATAPPPPKPDRDKRLTAEQLRSMPM